MAAKKKTTRAKSITSSKKTQPTIGDMIKKSSKAKEQEKVYSFEELADIFGVSKMKVRAYFNMCQLDYSEKITIKKARELFNKF